MRARVIVLVLRRDLRCVAARERVRRLARALERNTVLTRLCLDFNQIGNRGAQLLEGLSYNRALATLELAYCGLTPAVGPLLADGLMKCPTLKTLELKGNELGAQGVLAILNAIKAKPGLFHVGLADTSISREPDVQALLLDAGNKRRTQDGGDALQEATAGTLHELSLFAPWAQALKAHSGLMAALRELLEVGTKQASESAFRTVNHSLVDGSLQVLTNILVLRSSRLRLCSTWACSERHPSGPPTASTILGVKSVFCVFGVGLNSLCILCIWGPQNRSTAVVYFCVSVPRSNTPVFWCIWTPHLVYLTPRLPAPLAHPLSCEEEARTGRFSTSQAETRRWWEYALDRMIDRLESCTVHEVESASPRCSSPVRARPL